MMRIIWIIPVALLLLLGCGTDYKQYYEKVHDDLLVKRLAPLHDELLLALNKAMDLTPPDDASNKAIYDQIAVKTDELIQELSKIKPPEEFKNPHERLEKYLQDFKVAVGSAQKAASGDMNAGKLARSAFKNQVLVCDKCGVENYIDRNNYLECYSCKAELKDGYSKLGLVDQLKLIEDEFYGKKMIIDNK